MQGGKKKMNVGSRAAQNIQYASASRVFEIIPRNLQSFIAKPLMLHNFINLSTILISRRGSSHGESTTKSKEENEKEIK
jgi:hypothetical protein